MTRAPRPTRAPQHPPSHPQALPHPPPHTHRAVPPRRAFGQLQHYDYKLMHTLVPYLVANAARFDASGLAKVSRAASEA